MQNRDVNRSRRQTQANCLPLMALLLAFAWCAAPIAAQEEADPDPPGVKVGAQAPDFELVDQDGQQHTLKSLLKDDQWLAIVFHRSADW